MTSKSGKNKKSQVAEAEELITEPEIKGGAEDEQTHEEQLEASIAELKNKCMRMAADYENLKKRNAKISADRYLDGKSDAISKLLDIGDCCERALKMELGENEKEGIAQIKKVFDESMVKLGVEQIPSLNERFDPNYHNAIMMTEDEENSGKVTAVYQEGYKLGERIIRHASVVVAK